MSGRVLRLYPGPNEEVELHGLYLGHRLHRLGGPERPFVYADFVASLDGRIAVADRVPLELSGAHDLRLLLELLAQAECVVTHAGYLRAIAEGRLGDILEVGAGPECRDLAGWRTENGLAPQPFIAIASGSLDFPMPPSLVSDKARVLIATTSAAPADKVRAWRERGYEVAVAGGPAGVEGGPLTDLLGSRGHRSIFLLAGPRILQAMLQDRRLSRLYLTIVHRLLGGQAPQTMLSGPLLGGAGRLTLGELHHDPAGPEGAGQWFAMFKASRAT